MRISFERTGGFAGRKLQCFVDSDSLAPSQLRRIEDLLDQSHFFDLPDDIQAKGGGADRFEYRITVETEHQAHTIHAAESAIPQELRPLVDYLTRLIH